MIHPEEKDKLLFFDVGAEFWAHPFDGKLVPLVEGQEERQMWHTSGANAPTVGIFFQTDRENIYTNWTTCLLNNEGKTIERVFP